MSSLYIEHLLCDSIQIKGNSTNQIGFYASVLLDPATTLVTTYQFDPDDSDDLYFVDKITFITTAVQTALGPIVIRFNIGSDADPTQMIVTNWDYTTVTTQYGYTILSGLSGHGTQTLRIVIDELKPDAKPIRLIFHGIKLNKAEI